MIRYIIVGVWGVLVTCATVFAANHFGLVGKLTSHGEAPKAKIESMHINPMRVPIMAEGKVGGYVLLALSVAFDSAKGKEVDRKLADVVTDEAFREVYEAIGIDFAKSSKTDLTGLLARIGSRADARLGGGIISEVLVREFSYVSGNGVRR